MGITIFKIFYLGRYIIGIANHIYSLLIGHHNCIYQGCPFIAFLYFLQIEFQKSKMMVLFLKKYRNNFTNLVFVLNRLYSVGPGTLT